MTLTLVLGGARSGKSGFAQAEAEAEAEALAGQARRLVMIATGQAFDAEMWQRIEQHRRERGEAWRTVEAPVDLVGALAGLEPGDVAVVDCLTLWLSNLMMADMDVAAEASALVAAAQGLRVPVWFVSNEVGMGIVPENAMARRFRDEAGRLHRRLAEIVDHVVLIVAGLPMKLK